jgi:hypothetical protein
MIYSFLCPMPCNHEILIDAENDDDAVTKLMLAGALRCRNARYRCRCEKSKHDASPMSEAELRRTVSMCMCEKSGNWDRQRSASYG